MNPQALGLSISLTSQCTDINQWSTMQVFHHN